MFWKKRIKKEPVAKPFQAPQDSRKAFRVAPDPDQPIYMNIHGKTVEILEISPGGLSFKDIGLNPQTSYPAHFSLPLDNTDVSAQVKILRIDDERICRCVFLDLDPDFEEAIHRYSLDRQKEILRSKRF